MSEEPQRVDPLASAITTITAYMQALTEELVRSGQIDRERLRGQLEEMATSAENKSHIAEPILRFLMQPLNDGNQ